MAMNKTMLIDSILKMDASVAFKHDYGCELVDGQTCRTYPYRKYVNYSEKVIASIGIPLRPIIKEVHYSWDELALLKATNKELAAFYKVSKQIEDMKNQYVKYGKKMSMVDFLKVCYRNFCE